MPHTHTTIPRRKTWIHEVNQTEVNYLLISRNPKEFPVTNQFSELLNRFNTAGKEKLNDHLLIMRNTDWLEFFFYNIRYQIENGCLYRLQCFFLPERRKTNPNIQQDIFHFFSFSFLSFLVKSFLSSFFFPRGRG